MNSRPPRSRAAGVFFFMKRILLILAAVSVAADAPDAIVKYRQTAMKSLGAHMTAISMVSVKKQIASRALLAAHAEAVHAVSEGLVELFPMPDKTRSSAKPEIWTRMPEFKQAAAKLERESATLSRLAAKRDWKAFDAQVVVVMKACDECHDSFRVQN
jgi:cytochrome c556